MSIMIMMDWNEVRRQVEGGSHHTQYPSNFLMGQIDAKRERAYLRPNLMLLKIFRPISGRRRQGSCIRELLLFHDI